LFVRLSYRDLQLIPEVRPIIKDPNFLDIARALEADILEAAAAVLNASLPNGL